MCVRNVKSTSRCKRWKNIRIIIWIMALELSKGSPLRAPPPSQLKTKPMSKDEKKGPTKKTKPVEKGQRRLEFGT